MTTIVRTLGRGITRGAVSRIGLGTQALLLLTVMVLALGAAVGLLARQVHTDGQVAQARRDALAAARAHAEEILAYDYRTLDRDFAQAKADTTGKFRESYEDTTKSLVAPKARQHKVVVKATVSAASVVRATPDEVVTLLFVNQATTSDLVKGTKVDMNRVRMTLEKVDGRWLVSKVDAL